MFNENKNDRETNAGGARPGAGRPRGARNRRTTALSDKILNSGDCPAEALVKIAKNAEQVGDMGLALDAWKAVLPYVHAKPKAYEMYPENMIEMVKELSAVRILNGEDNTDLGERLDRAYKRLEEYETSNLSRS